MRSDVFADALKPYGTLYQTSSPLFQASIATVIEDTHRALAMDIIDTLALHDIDVNFSTGYGIAGVIRGYYAHHDIPAPQPPAVDGQDAGMSVG